MSTDDGSALEHSVGVRRPLLTRALLDVLCAAAGPVKAAVALDRVASQVVFNPYEAEPMGTHGTRGSTFLSWVSTYAARVGWLVKVRGVWTLTDVGREALKEAGPDEDLAAKLWTMYQAARSNAAEPTADRRDRLATLKRALELMPEGTWTSFTDLGELVGTNGGNVGAYLWRNVVPNVHRCWTSRGDR